MADGIPGPGGDERSFDLARRHRDSVDPPGDGEHAPGAEENAPRDSEEFPDSEGSVRRGRSPGDDDGPRGGDNGPPGGGDGDDDGRDGRRDGPRNGGRDGDDGAAGLRQILLTSLLTSQPSPPPPPPPPPAPVTSNFRADSEQALAEGEQLLGPVHPDRVIQILIHIKPSGDTLIEDSEALARDPLAKRAPLTREEYASRYAAKREDVGRLVRYYALQHGLQVVPNWSNRLRGAAPFADRTVHFRGLVGDINQAFGITMFHVLGKDGGLYRTYIGGLNIPSELTDLVSCVFNTDTRPKSLPHLRLSRPLGSGAPTRIGYTPIEVGQAYGFPSNVTGAGQGVAILELGGGARLGDLIQYFRSLGLQVPRIQAIGVHGASNAPTGDPSGPDGEVTLDIEVAGAIANGADYSVYFAPNTSAGMFQGISAVVHDAVNRPSILSISWGGPESTWSPLEMYSITEVLRAAAMMGMSVFVAAGDSGSTDGVGVSKPSVDFPASSPWATACGGTSLYIGASAPPEKVWNNGNAGGTGGGISATFPAPSFQTGLRFQSAPLVGRGLPDVCGCADPNTGYQLKIDGVDEIYGGTSAVAPLWSALTALINQSTGAPLGFVNPLLYLTNLKGALKDITVGNNDTTGLVGNYSAGVGWDPCTGFGSPNASAILAALS
jgi:kumamolisin